MRVAVSKTIRVGPGDTVTVRGQLASAKLGRLYVFARERGNSSFSPYVPEMPELISERPTLMSTMTMRLAEGQPEKQTSFVADFDGFLRVMQEVDTAKDPRAMVKLTRTICAHLPWHQRLARRLSGVLSWPVLKLS